MATESARMPSLDDIMKCFRKFGPVKGSDRSIKFDITLQTATRLAIKRTTGRHGQLVDTGQLVEMDNWPTRTTGRHGLSIRSTPATNTAEFTSD